MRMTNITMDLFAAGVTLVLFFVCMLRRKNTNRIDWYFLSWLIVHFAAITCDVLRWYLRGKIAYVPEFKFFYIMEYILCYIGLILFEYFLTGFLGNRLKSRRPVIIATWILSIVACTSWMISMQTHSIYSVTYNAVNISESYYMISRIPALLIILLDMGIIAALRHKIERILSTGYIACLLIAGITFPLSLIWNGTLIFIGVTFAQFCVYITITQEEAQMLAQSKIEIAISQIQPHFLYNALGSISELCNQDARLAGIATDHFAQYLRMNLDSMKRTKPIPFKTELNHIDTYLWLEKIRFGDKINVVYDIRDVDFMVPALCVQPLVENAVKHGICSLEHPGTIKISTYKKNNSYVVTIEDTGAGFDISKTENDGKIHIGIDNVKKRLRDMVDGKLYIKSQKGSGTTATIIIPEKQSRL